MRHELKIWPEYFDAIWEGLKTFEFRENDRGFNVGDEIVLRSWDPHVKDYTGDWLIRRVTYMLEGPAFGLPSGKAILALGEPSGVVQGNRSAA
jgi:ASCH domain.